MQTFKCKDAVKLLKKNGFVEKLGKGSHKRYVHELFDWLTVTVDEGHDISCNVYLEIIRVVALKKYLLCEPILDSEAKRDSMINDVLVKLNKSNLLELFNIEHSKMSLRDDNGKVYKIDNEENAMKFITRERQRVGIKINDKGVIKK